MPMLDRLDELGMCAMPAHLGIEFVDCGPDWISARMPVDHQTDQPFGRLHSGAPVALAETVGSMAAAMCIDPQVSFAVGMEINANHICPAYDRWVHATARAESIGRSTQVWSIRIEDEADQLVASRG